MNSPLTVISQAVSPDRNPRARAWLYVVEILSRAGVFYDRRANLKSQIPPPPSVLLLAGDLRLSKAERDWVSDFVRGGGALIGIGGTSGLEEVFGVSRTRPLAEGYIRVTATEHPITSGLRSSLHVFGGCAAAVGKGTALAEVDTGAQGSRGGAIVESRFGKGRAVLLAPDLIFSVLHIQQGVPILQDGKPAPDGTAPLNDGVLKAEDGLVLDWERDRQAIEVPGLAAAETSFGKGNVGFIEPVSDELREIILKSIFYLCDAQGVMLPILWYYPRDLKAVGHVSHDTDGNSPEHGWAMLEAMNGVGVKSTWCTLYPGGYPREFYQALKEQGYEIALHYDAMSGGERTSWSKENFLFQHKWLLKEAGIKHIPSNKNHYTRWEGRLDFFRWCEEVGIESDQTKGPSKRGAMGFPLGGSQPYFPLDDEFSEFGIRIHPPHPPLRKGGSKGGSRPRFIDVLEVNMLTQDLVVFAPAEFGRAMLESAARHRGVAHFLFHPAHILKPGVADALRGIVDCGRENGLEWWTSEQLVRWEKLRRRVEATFNADGSLTLRAPRPLSEATLLFLKPKRRRRLTVSVDGQVVKGERWTVYGFEFEKVSVTIQPRTTLAFSAR